MDKTSYDYYDDSVKFRVYNFRPINESLSSFFVQWLTVLHN